MHKLSVKVRTETPTKTWGIWNETWAKWHNTKEFPNYSNAIRGLAIEQLKLRR